MKSALCLLVVPLLAQEGPNFYGLEKERALGHAIAVEIRKKSKPLANPEIDAYLERKRRELVEQLRDTPLDYRFEAIAGGAWKEPFALPGRHVFIPARAFLAAQNEAEFVGMIAHSIGHAALRHGTRTATRGQTANLASIPLVFVGGAHADSEHLVVPMGFLKFVREYELEADRFGVALAARAGYDAGAFLRYVERTHPPNSERSPFPSRALRLSRLQETISSLPSFTASASGEDFRRVREAVRSMMERTDERRPPSLRD